jgi:biopolymer transport protein ExbD
MTIAQPGRRLMHAVKLRFVQKRVSGGAHRATNASLSLTSMIDFLVVTVVFLLITFSASGETPINKAVRLPEAQNTLDMIDAPMVAIAGSTILVDGSPAGNTRAVEESKRLQRIDELFNILKSKREVWKQLHPGKEFPGVVVLQIDQDVQAVVVKSVFQTAAFAGYPNVSFMVGSIPKPNTGGGAAPK